MSVACASCASAGIKGSASFEASFDGAPDRTWIGPDFYANRLQDWRIRDGRLEAVEARDAKPMRTAQLLTWALSAGPGSVAMEVRTGPIDGGRAGGANTWSGFLIGAGGEDVDYRISALVHHWPGEDGGLIVAMDGTGTIVVRDNSHRGSYNGSDGNYGLGDWPLVQPATAKVHRKATGLITLRAVASPGADGYALNVSALAPNGELIAEARYEAIPSHLVTGNVALVSHGSPNDRGKAWWFDDWRISGSKLVHHAERAFGPVVGVMYTVSEGVLKLTAQMVPLGEDDNQQAQLQVKKAGAWTTVDEESLVAGSYTVPFRVNNWSATADTEFRVTYDASIGDRGEEYAYTGTIRQPVAEKDEIVLAVLNCNNISSGVDMQWNGSTIWHPHADLLAAVQHHRPDLVFLAGDQLYEKGLAGIEREPLDVALLDYLYHWYRFYLAFGDLTRHTPSVAIPDDHDVYHGNIWGEGGKPAIGPFELQHDNGGYIMDPAWVNAVHRTQTSHLPDPADPTPVEQGISVFYTELKYGGISYAIIADRMWKSAPRPLLPEAKVWNGWIENPDFDPVDADVPGAVLLGDRQLAFLESWAADWSNDTWMKVVLSATPFTNVATLPDYATNDAVVPDLVYPQEGEYVEGDKAVADMDSNGWPQTGRNQALRTIRKAFAFHVAGDQHLSSFIHYGVDDWRDSGYAFVAPAIANFWPRRWFPPQPGQNREPGSPLYSGDHLDGFGNKLTVHAVANPVKSNREPAALYDRSPGYGIVRFRRSDRTITAESWPRWVDPVDQSARQYNGWPITVSQEHNYGRAAAGFLPSIRVSGLDEPVVQVVNQANGETVYTIRASGRTFRPKIFDLNATYSIKVSNPNSGESRVLTGISPDPDESQVLDVAF